MEIILSRTLLCFKYKDINRTEPPDKNGTMTICQTIKVMEIILSRTLLCLKYKEINRAIPRDKMAECQYGKPLK